MPNGSFTGQDACAYRESDLLRLAKRFANAKRPYLLVNPLQGKHLRVSPSRAMAMFHALGEKVKSAYPKTRLVIGFAETATAVGMGVAEVIADDCIYIHTTREELPGESEWIEFHEEHSHAVEQKILALGLREWISNTESIVFVDDEISTGKTLRNFVEQLKQHYPEIHEKTLVAASIINRVSKENEAVMAKHGLAEISLLKLDHVDDWEQMEQYPICEAGEAHPAVDGFCEMVDSSIKLKDPRRGVAVGDYLQNCVEFAGKIAEDFLPEAGKWNVLVLGTEECMYPAIRLGMLLEQYPNVNVHTHSTTRSPIGVCGEGDYPIWNGYRLKSLYDEGRNTYLYNVSKYDIVLIVTDSTSYTTESAISVVNALWVNGNDRIILICG